LTLKPLGPIMAYMNNTNTAANLPYGSVVRYHGSLTEAHGEAHYLGPEDWDLGHVLVLPDGRTLRRVGGGSFSVLRFPSEDERLRAISIRCHYVDPLPDHLR
jgi:hypothetical protein